MAENLVENSHIAVLYFHSKKVGIIRCLFSGGGLQTGRQRVEKL
jgi:hypothetical protein